VGGETCRSPGPIFISIALTGRVRTERCVRRSGARPGDFIYVTGKLGGSIRGKHLTFTPRIKEGQWLAGTGLVTAMMDLSDGLGADLPRILHASNCGADLWHEAIPRSPRCTIEQAIGDGEDYELLLAVKPEGAEKLEKRWQRRFPQLRLTRIGIMAPAGTKTWNNRRGYDHFA
jgi:thiamine-monophosphate kinase